ncbi:MAG: hypothetical protein FWG67_05440 [Defluviitaleaceae bacterium]|nr:hypothetical protein [Defluviitaleaceae bacterium]
MERPFRAKLLDKEILEKRKQALKEKYVALEEGVYLQGEIKAFERQEILNIISIMMPTDFMPMPENYAKVKYPSEFRPECIAANVSLNVNMGFTTFPNNLKNKDPEQMTKRVRETLHLEQAGLDFSECEKLENIDGYWFGFRNHGMDQDVYNMLLIIAVNQKVLQINFNCPINEQSDWKKVVAKMWESIEAIKEEGVKK